VHDFTDYIDHVEKCGSKTFHCEKCKKYVCKKDKESHYQYGECERNSRIAKEIEKQIRDDKAKELKKF
jgi:hypothetical protein